MAQSEYFRNAKEELKQAMYRSNNVRNSGGVRNAKEELTHAIYRTKKVKWEELRRDVYNDFWIYGVAMGKLEKSTACPALKSVWTEGIVYTFFPTYPERSAVRHFGFTPM